MVFALLLFIPVLYTHLSKKVAFLKKTAIILIYNGISVVYAWSFFGLFCLFLPIFARFFSRDFFGTSETLAMRGLQTRCFQ
jgi:hypothetical protein